MSCMSVWACVQSDLKPKENTNILQQAHKTPENWIIYCLSYKRENTRKISVWADRVNSRHSITILSFSCVCLIAKQWDLQLQEVNPCFLLCSLLWLFVAVLQKSLPMFQDCWLVVLFLFCFFSLITLSLKHRFITKRNYLVSNLCLVGKGNNWQWTPGLYAAS